ncbi:hypothetical protein ABIA39_002030 [Nocardia sp. GAS34]
MDVCFNVESRFPDPVFRIEASRTVFIEYEVGDSPRFSQDLSDLARIHGDTHVDCLVLDPGRGSINVPEGCGVYPAFSMDVSASEDEVDAVYTESVPGDDESIWLMGDLSNVIAYSGRSAMWGCWGQRNLGIMAIRGADTSAFQGWRKSLRVSSGSLNEFLGIVAFNFRGDIIPPRILDDLVKNYPE